MIAVVQWFTLMTVGPFLLLPLKLSISLLVFSLGLPARLADTTYLVPDPRLLLRSFVSMNLVMPVFAAVMAWAFHLDPAVKIALVFLAVMFASVLLPLALDILAGHHAPRAPTWVSQSLSAIALLLLVAAVVALLGAIVLTIISLIGNGAIAAIVAFVVVGVAIGHWLGAPDPAERTVLALATASRQPGLALVMVRVNCPIQLRTARAAILLYPLVKSVVPIPYYRRHKRDLSMPSQLEDCGCPQRVT